MYIYIYIYIYIWHLIKDVDGRNVNCASNFVYLLYLYIESVLIKLVL